MCNCKVDAQVEIVNPLAFVINKSAECGDGCQSAKSSPALAIVVLISLASLRIRKHFVSIWRTGAVKLTLVFIINFTDLNNDNNDGLQSIMTRTICMHPK